MSDDPMLPRPVTTYDLFAILVELGVDEGYEDADWRAVAIRRVRNRIRKRILEADPSSANTPLMATEPPRVNEFSGPPFERAPAWTREAPTSDGLFWIRFESGSFEGGSTVAYWDPPFEGDAETLSFDGANWTLAYARELYPEFEWWPVRLEPPAS